MSKRLETEYRMGWKSTGVKVRLEILPSTHILALLVAGVEQESFLRELCSDLPRTATDS